jgi:hypothetical protein
VTTDASYQNPFRARASEHQRDLFAFLRNYGAGVIDLLPETLWDRPLVIRSAPGGGKTSLMRLFTIESLQLVHERQAYLEGLGGKLAEIGALTDEGPTRLGIQLGLERDYRSLLDIGLPEDAGLRLFFRLLDARIAVATLRAAVSAAGGLFPDDVSRVKLESAGDQAIFVEASTRLGGPDGAGMLETARKVESHILDLLDSLLPISVEELAQGHVDLYALRALSVSRVLVDNVPLRVQPLVMFDDGHLLASLQRTALLERLFDRGLTVSRWYSERFEALSAQELLEGDIEGRDYELLEIEAAARGVGHRGRRSFRFDRFLQDVGNRRAAPTLMRYGEASAFTDELEVDADDVLGDRAEEVTAALEAKVRQLGQGPRYAAWLADAAHQAGFAAALRWRELSILIERDLERPTLELFDFALEETDADRMGGSSVREAARLFMSREHKLPYYWGADAVNKLGSQNVEQYLSVSGELFEEMLAAMVLSRPPRLTAAQQDAVIRRASERFWRTIPRRVPHGRDVQRLLISIASIARRDTFRPTAPYSPGVTGTALSMADREHLIHSSDRSKIQGGDRLFDALGAAIAYNVLSAELDRPSKGDRVMVLYLNRLLCPRFSLPLGRGGFRERRLGVMAGWMLQPEVDPNDVVEMDLGLA